MKHENFCLMPRLRIHGATPYFFRDFTKLCLCKAYVLLVTYGTLLVSCAGAALETLSAARVGIMAEGTNACCSAVAIAVRYAAVRKQFGSTSDGTEFPIIEYQLHVSLLGQHSYCCPFFTDNDSLVCLY